MFDRAAGEDSPRVAVLPHDATVVEAWERAHDGWTIMVIGHRRVLGMLPPGRVEALLQDHGYEQLLTHWRYLERGDQYWQLHHQVFLRTSLLATSRSASVLPYLPGDSPIERPRYCWACLKGWHLVASRRVERWNTAGQAYCPQKEHSETLMIRISLDRRTG
jgi:hypothetical protein